MAMALLRVPMPGRETKGQERKQFRSARAGGSGLGVSSREFRGSLTFRFESPDIPANIRLRFGPGMGAR